MPILTNPAFLRQLILWISSNMDAAVTPEWAVLRSEWRVYVNGMIKGHWVFLSGKDGEVADRKRPKGYENDVVDKRVSEIIWKKVMDTFLSNMQHADDSGDLRNFVHDQVEFWYYQPRHGGNKQRRMLA